MLSANAEKYIVAADVPVSQYHSVISSVYLDADGVERVAYSGYLLRDGGGDLTVSEYLAEKARIHPDVKLTVVDDAGLEARHQAYIDHAKHDEKEITQDDWFWKLECLPPCQWKMVGGVELFHMSERICFNLVSWLGRIGDQYFELVDLATTPTSVISSRFQQLKAKLTVEKQDVVH